MSIRMIQFLSAGDSLYSWRFQGRKLQRSVRPPAIWYSAWRGGWTTFGELKSALTTRDDFHRRADRLARRTPPPPALGPTLRDRGCIDLIPVPKRAPRRAGRRVFLRGVQASECCSGQAAGWKNTPRAFWIRASKTEFKRSVPCGGGHIDRRRKWTAGSPKWGPEAQVCQRVRWHIEAMIHRQDAETTVAVRAS